MAKRLFIDLELCRKCDKCEVACSYFYHPFNSGAIYMRELAEFAVTCRQCDEAPCVASCPSEALEKQEDGIVKRYNLRCVSCNSCSYACPFGTILRDLDEEMPIRDIFKRFWFNAFEYTSQSPEFFQFTEQFSNSPYSDLVDKGEVEKYFEPMFRVIARGIEQKIIKDVPMDILSVFIFYPVMLLSNPRMCEHIVLNKETIETSFSLSWDAIRL